MELFFKKIDNVFKANVASLLLEKMKFSFYKNNKILEPSKSKAVAEDKTYICKHYKIL